VEKGVSIHVKRSTFSVLIGTALFASLSGSSAADWIGKENSDSLFFANRNGCQIRIDGKNYEGRWAIIGDRPYVNVESFGKALGLPRRHNVKNWYLSSQGNPKGSPFQMQVESVKGKLPTTRFGGGTFVDLAAACKAMDIPLHWDTRGRVFEVGEAYEGQYMIGAWKRWYNGKDRLYNATSTCGAKDQGNFYDPHIDANKTDGI
jgi:hypothetical protein